ncbi:MAG: DUF1501 domain-containing protein [Planctomycetes bacterium]|nr:DUF1501 domain-containing protein [Planctomycetota bacterium]
MNPLWHSLRDVTRRTFLRDSGLGLGGLALGDLMRAGATGTPDRVPHHRPRARSVIYLHMAGSPSPLDTFDPKPKLRELDGQPCPEELFKTERFAFIKGVPRLLGAPHGFAQHGQSGMWVTELMPHTATIVDELCMVRSMYTDQFNHAPAQLLLQTGSPRLGRPSMGAWVDYGLGSPNRDLPAFVVLISGGKVPSAGRSAWGAGFLPSVHQGVQLRSAGEPVLYLGDPPGMDRAQRRRTVDAMRDLDELRLAEHGDPETAARIAQYELAYRMQTSVPDVCDIDREPQRVLDAYGATPGGASFANNCLLARRLVESGVRFVQLYDWGWDLHGTGPNDDLMTQFPKKCRETDRPVAALIKDLKARGLLDDTLVVWGGEFGRTPMNEKRNGSTFLGRDHHPHCFTVWLAGGGTRAGHVHGATDEIGYHITSDPVHVHDLQATVLYLLGLDHERLTYRFQGRDYRLTDVHGRVVEALLA